MKNSLYLKRRSLGKFLLWIPLLLDMPISGMEKAVDKQGEQPTELAQKKEVTIIHPEPAAVVDLAQSGYDALINLGGDCQVQWQMNVNKLREYALPFDFLMASVSSVCALLEQDFKGYLAKEHLELKKTETGTYVLDTLYDTRLIHDFPLDDDFLRKHAEIHEKYARRIERLLSLLKEKSKILFIRKNCAKEDIIKLDLLIKSKYPNLDYTIAALHGTDEIKVPWDLPRVHNFFLSQPVPYSWKGDNSAWQAIFRTLKVIN